MSVSQKSLVQEAEYACMKKLHSHNFLEKILEVCADISTLITHTTL